MVTKAKKKYAPLSYSKSTWFFIISMKNKIMSLSYIFFALEWTIKSCNKNLKNKVLRSITGASVVNAWHLHYNNK